MQPGEIGPRLLQDLYIAQVLLSLDASDQARESFRSVLAPGSSETETARLSAAVVLSQVLLLDRRHDEYAELATETLAPLLLKRHHARPGQPPSDTLDLARQIPDLAGGLALLPLSSRTFLSGLTDARLKSMVARWEVLRNQADDDLARLVVDLALEASYGQLGRKDQGRQALERIQKNPALGGVGANARADLSRGVTDETIEMLRVLLAGTMSGMPPGGIGP